MSHSQTAAREQNGRAGAEFNRRLCSFAKLRVHVLRPGKAQPQPFQGEPAPLADDEVIQQLDIEQLPGRHDFHGESHIGRRGGRISRRVVMNRHDRGGLLAYRVAEDLGHPHLGLDEVVNWVPRVRGCLDLDFRVE